MTLVLVGVGCGAASSATSGGAGTSGGGAGFGGTSGAAGTSGDGGCPHATLDDVWLNQRLGCLSVGELVSPTLAQGNQNATADVATIVAQQTLDSGFNNVLPTDNGRYFRYLVCVRQAGIDLLSPTGGVPFAGDLASAFHLGLGGEYPPGVSASTLEIRGNGEPSSVAVPCDPSVHPVILDKTGKVESLNPGALGSLTIIDKSY